MAKAEVNAFRRIDRLAAHVSSRWSAWKADRESLEEKWKFWYRQWRCVEDPQDKTMVGNKTRDMERSQIKMPATKEAVNIFLDAAMQIIFASEDFFDIFPRNNLPDTVARSLLLKKYMRYLFDHERFPEKIESFLTQMAVYGWCPLKVEPSIEIKQRTVKMEEFDDVGTPTGSRSIVVQETTIFRPSTRIPHVENFVVNPTATNIDDAEGCIERSVVFFSDLLDMERKGLVDSAAISSLRGKASSESDSSGVTVDEDQRDRLSHSGIYPSETNNDQTELFDWWGYVTQDILDEAGIGELGENGGAEMHILCCAGHTTLKASLNPYAMKKRPFMACSFEPIPGEFYGMGICEAAEGPQRALDATIRSRIDNKALAINQIFGINVNKMIPGQNLKLYPGKSFLFNGPPGEALYPMAIPDVTNGSYVEAQEFERYVQHATGISRIMGGMPSKAGEQTASEVQTLVQRSSGRIRRIVKRFENSIMEPLLRWYYQILFETMNVGEAFRVTNDQTGAQSIIQITPDDVEGDYDFIPQASISMANQAKLAKMMQFMAQAANPILGQFVNWPYMLKKVYDGMGFVDADQALLLQPPPMQMVPGGLPNIGTQPSPMGPTPQPGGAVGTQGPPMPTGPEGAF